MSPTNPLPQDKLAAIATYLPRSGALSDINRDFHQTYEELVGQVLARLERNCPVILAIGDDLTLLDRGIERTETFIPAAYHQLKAVSHATFGVQLALASNDAAPLSKAARARLEAKLLLIKAAHRRLPEQRLPEEARDSAAAVLSLSQALIDDVLNAGAVDSQSVAEFGRRVAPSLATNFKCAVRGELDRLHEIVTAWRRDLGEDRWRNVYVVICDRHQPRYRQAATQYFQRLLNERAGQAAELEDRVIYAEGVTDVVVALDLLARHMIDQEASRIFFGDRRRLQEDVLADAAADYLEVLLPVE